MRYRPDIDGLRAVAVISVVLFHAGVPTFGGGFVGVDIFFVISGFLITSIISRDIEEDRFSVLGFYERRVRRIFPALAFVCAITFAVGLLVLTPSRFKDFSQSFAATALFSSNFLFWKESGYFTQASETKPLLHTWSLSVEEQFYIVFPLLLWLLKMRFNSRVLASIWFVAVVSFVVNLCRQRRARQQHSFCRLVVGGNF